MPWTRVQTAGVTGLSGSAVVAVSATAAGNLLLVLAAASGVDPTITDNLGQKYSATTIRTNTPGSTKRHVFFYVATAAGVTSVTVTGSTTVYAQVTEYTQGFPGTYAPYPGSETGFAGTTVTTIGGALGGSVPAGDYLAVLGVVGNVSAATTFTAGSGVTSIVGTCGQTNGSATVALGEVLSAPAAPNMNMTISPANSEGATGVVFVAYQLTGPESFGPPPGFWSRMFGPGRPMFRDPLAGGSTEVPPAAPPQDPPAFLPVHPAAAPLAAPPAAPVVVVTRSVDDPPPAPDDAVPGPLVLRPGQAATDAPGPVLLRSTADPAVVDDPPVPVPDVATPATAGRAAPGAVLLRSTATDVAAGRRNLQVTGDHRPAPPAAVLASLTRAWPRVEHPGQPEPLVVPLGPHQAAAAAGPLALRSTADPAAPPDDPAAPVVAVARVVTLAFTAPGVVVLASPDAPAVQPATAPPVVLAVPAGRHPAASAPRAALTRSTADPAAPPPEVRGTPLTVAVPARAVAAPIPAVTRSTADPAAAPVPMPEPTVVVVPARALAAPTGVVTAPRAAAPAAAPPRVLVAAVRVLLRSGPPGALILRVLVNPAFTRAGYAGAGSMTGPGALGSARATGGVTGTPAAAGGALGGDRDATGGVTGTQRPQQGAEGI